MASSSSSSSPEVSVRRCSLSKPPLFSMPLIILILLLIPFSCQARVSLSCNTNNPNVRLCEPPLQRRRPTMTTLECKDDFMACEKDCNANSGCFFTCVDDVGFYCLCHCDPEIRLLDQPHDNEHHLFATS
uniref:Uncharacterized protein n=1 Tax=Opuntia streptacantha TaxID=393608 RepID=A0A7C9CHS8_OPUST